MMRGGWDKMGSRKSAVKRCPLGDTQPMYPIGVPEDDGDITAYPAPRIMSIKKLCWHRWDEKFLFTSKYRVCKHCGKEELANKDGGYVNEHG